jgi:para-nitrobenzyl esterase
VPDTFGDDCLNLNIWTPELGADSKLPVMVWIHGGSLMAGAAGVDYYDGQRLANHGALVISINYRVGVVGFLAGDELFDADVCTGNRGLMDQVAVLQWVQANAPAFGGIQTISPSSVNLPAPSQYTGC